MDINAENNTFTPLIAAGIGIITLLVALFVGVSITGEFNEQSTDFVYPQFTSTVTNTSDQNGTTVGAVENLTVAAYFEIPGEYHAALNGTGTFAVALDDVGQNYSIYFNNVFIGSVNDTTTYIYPLPVASILTNQYNQFTFMFNSTAAINNTVMSIRYDTSNTTISWTGNITSSAEAGLIDMASWIPIVVTVIVAVFILGLLMSRGLLGGVGSSIGEY